MWLGLQESANVDDRHANRPPNAEGHSVAASHANANGNGNGATEGSSDSIELGLPHEPLSITFFKTAFSITGLGLPGARHITYSCFLYCIASAVSSRRVQFCILFGDRIVCVSPPQHLLYTTYSIPEENLLLYRASRRFLLHFPFQLHTQYPRRKLSPTQPIHTLLAIGTFLLCYCTVE